MENNWGAYSVPDNPLPLAFGSNSWVRLQRVASVFHVYTSSNGVDWVPFYQTTGGLRVFPDEVYLGIAANAHSSNQLANFKVSDFGPTPTITVNLATTLALLEYRRANFCLAAKWCNRVLDYPESDPVHVCLAQTLLSMANERLQRPDQARLQLAAARDLIQPKFSDALQSNGDTDDFWFEWLYARVLWREARAMIDPLGASSSELNLN
jgi:hypothetical protein